MRNPFFIVPAFLLMCIGINAQPIQRFRKVIGDPSAQNMMVSIDTCSDGGWIMGGYRDAGAGVRSSYLIRTDVTGTPLWNKEYFQGNRNYINDVIATSDGGFLFTGFAQNSNQWNDAQVVKTDPLGNIVWSYTYNLGAFSSGAQVIEDANSYYIIGTYDSLIPAGAETGALLFRLDNNGNVLSASRVQLNNINPGCTGGYVLCKAQNGDIVAAASSGNAIIVLRFDANCVLLEQKTVNHPSSSSVIPVAIGENYSGVWMVADEDPVAGTDYFSVIRIRTDNTIELNRMNLPNYKFGFVSAQFDPSGYFTVAGECLDMTNRSFPFTMNLHMTSVQCLYVYNEYEGIGTALVRNVNGTITMCGAYTYTGSLNSMIMKLGFANLVCDMGFWCANTPRNYISVTTTAGAPGFPASISLPRFTFAPGQTLFNNYSEILCVDIFDYNFNPSDSTVYELYIPNAFTPNGDELNDVFIPVVPDEATNYHFMIFDRWGELIFETTDRSYGWDGTYKSNLCQNGVYVWKVGFTRPSLQVTEKHIGSVTLIR